MPKHSKICKVCNQDKPSAEFPKRGNHRLKTCTVCYNAKQNYLWREKYKNDPEFRKTQIEESRAIRWKYMYNTTSKDVYTTLDEQEGKCSNTTCRKPITLDPLDKTIEKAHIDHCHTTGKFRSLMCSSCNTLLGRLEKNPNQIAGLIEYLERFKQEKE